ncbi:MAG: aldehyde dehydrogenase family protein [Armatimonadetes bacterium]|nr:aldehyde dehydrogenase family protein [Armatimonadota bacterium]
MAGRDTVTEAGAIVAGEECATGEWLESGDPWTNETIGRCAVSNWEQCDRALEAAINAWESPPPLPDRVRAAVRAADLIADRQAELTDLLMRETGKPTQMALGEVQRLERTFRLASESANELDDRPLDLSFDPRGSGVAGSWRRFAAGPVMAFVPYNWPLNLAAHKLAPALIAGCPVLLKVSPLAPLCSFALGRLLLDAGVAPAFLSVMHLSDELAQRVLKDDRVKTLSFTGSARVGWMLKEMVPTKRVALELGGNAPVIVEPDADLERMADLTALSGYAYAGQVCISAQNVFVHEAVYKEAHAQLAHATEATRTGDPRTDGVVCGPLINEGAAQKVRDRIGNAVRDGARVVATAHAEEHPKLARPTLVEEVPRDQELFCEEVFGPVLTLTRYKSLVDLMAQLNRGRYRLHASIFTASRETADLAFTTLRYGGVIHNDSPSIRFDNMPYGGEGLSGFGREGVRFALLEMTTPRALLHRGDL